MRRRMQIRRFSREGIMGCVVCASQEMGLSREQTEGVLDLLAGELDVSSDSDAVKALEDFYSDEL